MVSTTLEGGHHVREERRCCGRAGYEAGIERTAHIQRRSQASFSRAVQPPLGFGGTDGAPARGQCQPAAPVGDAIRRCQAKRYAEAVPRTPAAALLPVTTSMPSSTRPAISSDSCIEISFAAATIRVRGAVDARVLGVVLDCLAQRRCGWPPA